MRPNEKIILDLCGGTGAWSDPYKEAGYDVRLINTPDHDVRDFKAPENVYGILVAPPCTMFSYARSNAKEPRDLKGAMEVVEACLRIIWECQYSGKRLKFWALENPVARLQWFLGKPVMIFSPHEFGDRYIKHTGLWGNFNCALERNEVELTVEELQKVKSNSRDLPDLPNGYIIPDDMTLCGAKRSITPRGFAEAFMKANR